MIHIWYANLTMYDEWHLHSCSAFSGKISEMYLNGSNWGRGRSCSLVAGEKQTLLLSRETIHVKFSSGWQLYVCNDVTPDINVKAILIKHFQINNHIDRARDRTRSNIGAIYSSQELALSQDLKMMRLKFYSNNWCTKKKDKFKLLWHDQLVSFILGPPCLAFESWIRSLNGKFKMVTSL